MSEYILELRGISKTFPGVKALDDVNFNLKPGEIHSIMGENGAGKSTLIKIMTGVYIADEGQMFFNGESVVNPGRKQTMCLPPPDRTARTGQVSRSSINNPLTGERIPLYSH